MPEHECFLRRSLCASEQDDLRVLDALRWPTPFGTGLRIYLGRGAEKRVFKTPKTADIRLTDTSVIAGITVISGTAPDGHGPVKLDLSGRPLLMPTALPEPALFDDLNVFLALRHNEKADQLADWLGYHATLHDLTGVVLFDRSAPGPAQEDLANALPDILQGLPQIRRFALVSCPVPLGQPDQPPLGHPATAPRAKDRRFQADPWLAPLNEPALYEILKTRFLTRAGAVIALDPCDMLRPSTDGIGVFDACRQSHTGLMPVQGQMVYPWRIRKGQDPRLGDHICRADPPVQAPSRWALAPKRAEMGAVWLPHTIAGMAGLADEVVDYDQAASIRSPQAEIPTLVNKELLVADKPLLTRAGDHFDHAPILPPERIPARGLISMAPTSGRTLIVTCMKNEGPFILEWLAYHRLIGVDDFLIYTNDCDDGTVELLDLLQERGLVQRRENPFKDTGARPQHAALEAAQSEQVLKDACWIISMDVDEFINVHVGNNRLPDLYDAIGDANMISLTWRLFGNSDIESYEDRPVIEQFTRCAPQLIRRPHQAWGFKTLFRDHGLWEGIGVHRPKGPLGGPIKWVNGSGKPMPGRMLRTGWRSAMDSVGYDLVTLNHYSVRSVESFLVKRDRGRVNHVARDQGEAYWFRMNNNDELDLSIQRHVHGVSEELDKLKVDPAIADMHNRVVAAHRAKIRALLQDPEYAGMHARLCGERMRRLSRMHRHFGMNVFLHGPSVVPDRVFQPDLPPNFFFNTDLPDGKAAD